VWNVPQALRRSHKVVALFLLMVLLPAVVFSVLIVRAVRSARIRQFRHRGLAEQTWWPAGRNNAGAELSQF